mmetsp:Transcript_26526/g.79698  ORF Transcript_26526/g.79698 Transcript_26526/m.79698 type:complete len:318 (-) Transcript_26526:387-1340(-)
MYGDSPQLSQMSRVSSVVDRSGSARTARPEGSVSQMSGAGALRPGCCITDATARNDSIPMMVFSGPAIFDPLSQPTRLRTTWRIVKSRCACAIGMMRRVKKFACKCFGLMLRPPDGKKASATSFIRASVAWLLSAWKRTAYTQTSRTTHSAMASCSPGLECLSAARHVESSPGHLEMKNSRSAKESTATTSGSTTCVFFALRSISMHGWNMSSTKRLHAGTFTSVLAAAAMGVMSCTSSSAQACRTFVFCADRSILPHAAKNVSAASSSSTGYSRSGMCSMSRMYWGPVGSSSSLVVRRKKVADTRSNCDDATSPSS